MDVGIIYTGERHLMTRLLSSLQDCRDNLHLRLILIDNNSEDGIVPWMGYFPDTVVLRNAERLGYSANMNRIQEASQAKYTLLLNTDMYFNPQEQCVSKMVDFMERQQDCGIACCRIYHEDGGHAPSARRFQTIPTILGRRFGLGKLLQGTLDHYLYREHNIHDSWQSDWLSGCFMMVRREAFDEVGDFDTRFTKYFEDVDMCLRMAIAGWQVMYHGETYCHHLEQRASKGLFSIDAWTHARSYLRWLKKWGFSPRRNLPQERAPKEVATKSGHSKHRLPKKIAA